MFSILCEHIQKLVWVTTSMNPYLIFLTHFASQMGYIAGLPKFARGRQVTILIVESVFTLPFISSKN